MNTPQESELKKQACGTEYYSSRIWISRGEGMFFCLLKGFFGEIY